jgi:hypothetical protein
LHTAEHNEGRLVRHVDLCHRYFQGPQIKDMKIGCTSNSTAQYETRVEVSWEILTENGHFKKQILDIHIVRILHEINRLKKVSK